MNRLHSREEYMIDKIRAIIRTAISQDMIAGFPTDRTRPQRHFESNGICKV
jgi:tRNA A37 methylthiotransferase MiaB